MISAHTYLTFNGNCEAAFNFYKSVFGGDFDFIGRFKDMPSDPNCKVNPEDHEKIMHVSLKIGESTIMGSDTGGEWGSHYKAGNNFSISLNTDSQAEADQLYAALSADGQETMPMSETFWGSYFGMLTDQFGIQWMISFDTKPKA